MQQEVTSEQRSEWIKNRPPHTYVQRAVPASLTDELVLVTGASGHVATNIIIMLQQAGYKVRGTVRSVKNEEKIKPIRDLCPDAKHPIELVEADLLSEDGWVEAIDGCTYVLHVASPFPMSDPNHEDEVIKPALEGTLNVLRACAKNGSVKRVVLTSSGAAIESIGSDRVFTEADWSDHTREGVVPYCKSKVLAEKAAWDFVKETGAFELAVINPTFVLGPVYTGGMATSMVYVKGLMLGAMATEPNRLLPICDSRDVARAHILAMTLPEAAGKRFAVHTGTMTTEEIGSVLHREFSPLGFNPPTKQPPATPETEKTILLDNTRLRTVLKIEPIPIETTLIDMVHSMIDNGILS